MKLVTATEMRALEQRADAHGNSYATMMERAGKTVADAIAERLAPREARVLVLIGPGNNGGDGLVCARYLRDAGARVSLYLWKRAENSADENWRLCRERDIPETRAESDADFVALKTWVGQADVIVDALLGTGVGRPIEGLLKDLLETGKKEMREIREHSDLAPLLPRSPAPLRRFVVAIDLPSGLNPDTGALDPATMHADLTVTFAFPKIGQLQFPGANAVGELVVADIGIPGEWADANDVEVASAREIAALLPARARDSHKGTFGKAMLCVGSANYVGAAFLAGSATTRAGAGLVTLALARTIYPLLASALHETTFVRLPDDDGVLVPDAASVLCNQLTDYDALLVGCGFGRDPKTGAFVQSLLTQFRNSKFEIRNWVFDADALYALSQTPEWWTHLAPNTAILTPHPGEMATLTGLSRAEVQANRIEIAKKFAAQWQQVVVLKGAFTVVASPNGHTTLLPFATPALATAGTGDVLAGTIVAMLAQKLSPFDAAVVGAYIHGLAGEIAAREIGDAGVVAGDLLTRLPEAMRRIANSYPLHSNLKENISMSTAILSVHDKTGLVAFARGLRDLGWTLIASGGTAKTLRENQVAVTQVAEYTGSPEILGGRVKTLHPAIHGGLLARATSDDRAQLQNLGWDYIDLVVCNLYPFEQTIAKPGVTLDEAIENIDIGGVTLIRAAAKNFARVTLVCDPNDYASVLDELRAGNIGDATRQRLARKGFAHTAQYDAAIASYLAGDDALRVNAYRAQTLRYGENPHQRATLYAYEPGTGPLGGKFLQGKELSYNNLLDLDAAWRAAVSFARPTICIVKHLSPCGIASSDQLAEAYRAAFACDTRSAFGGVIASNRAFDGDTARALAELFVECIAAPGFSDDARAVLSAKKNCRLVAMPNLAVEPRYELRSITRGLLKQDLDVGDPGSAEWKVVSKRAPTEAEMRALQFAWRAVQHVKSNAIVFARGEATVGIGGGQPNRVDCVRIAAERAGENARGAVMASDAFFPFADSVETAIRAGITAIVHPGGSQRDAESLAAADAAGVAMVVTGVRHFRH